MLRFRRAISNSLMLLCIGFTSQLITACTSTDHAKFQEPVIDKRIEGNQSGMMYRLVIPSRFGDDKTIMEDAEELIAETENVLVELRQEMDQEIRDLPPVQVRFMRKGRTLIGDPEQPEAKKEDRTFHDRIDGNPEFGAKDAQPIESFSAYKPATRNEFRLLIPSEIRELVLRNSRAIGRVDGYSGPDRAKSDESVEGNHEENLEPLGWSLNDDNRVRLRPLNTTITTWPWRTITHFSYGGANSGCSGTLIGPRHIVTAAHCMNASGSDNFFAFTVSAERNGTALLAQSVMPGCPNSSTQACPNIGATYWYFTPSQWRQSSVSNREQYDIGIIVIPNRLGDSVGWMGYWDAPINSLNTVNKYSRGYPSCNASSGGQPRIDDPADPLACNTCTTDLTTCNPNHLYGDASSCSIGNATNIDFSGYNRNFRMSCDGSAAMSGSPLYLYGNGNVGSSGSVYYTAHDIQWLCGGTATASSCGNVTRADRLVRLTPEYAGWISFFRSQFP